MQFISTIINALRAGLDLILHLDKYLNYWLDLLGSWTYGLIFLIIFLESGVVACPFLPGDSLLFAMGALAAANPDQLNIWVLFALLSVAGITGGSFNYQMGLKWGPKLFEKAESKWLNKKHLLKTQEFYEKHGGKTVIVARFIPIVRTFAPFVAGMAKMDRLKFNSFNVVGGLLWGIGVTSIGYFFGNLPIIKENFGLVVPLIIVVSVIPVVWEMVAHKLRKNSTTVETQNRKADAL